MNATIDILSFPNELNDGIAALRSAISERFAPGGRPLRLARFADKAERGLRIEASHGGIDVSYSRPVDAFRAIGILLGGARIEDGDRVAQASSFDSLGVMLDASRNGAYTAGALRDLILRAALMGIDACMLYMEDVYEVPGEAFFGYLRGAYSAGELKALDDYASSLGVELFPCIQTLGHLEQILQWPAYKEYRDDERIILAEDPKTYELLEKMIAAASAPFRSRRINLGMDEASGIGQGNYKRLFGEKRPFDIMNAHLAKARDICARRGLEPVIWSDMYFRLGSKTHGYYDKEWRLPEGVAERIPEDVRLVYWDYYHEDYDFYREWIRRHRELGSEPLVALGSWTWNRFWAELDFAARTIAPGMRACRDEGIREAILTNWGDDGMEVDIKSALPAWQLFAECAYAGGSDPEAFAASAAESARENFRGSVGGDYDAWVGASALDRLPGVESRPINPSKVLLYEDVLLGMWDPQYPIAELPAHYASLASRLEAAAAKGGADSALAFPALIARVLAAKTALRPRLAQAYLSRDLRALRALAESDLPLLSRLVDDLWRAHRELWLATYKPFGLEVLEMRYGFVRTRLASLSERLAAFMDGRVDSIPELETVLRPPYAEAQKLPEAECFRRIATPSRIV